MTTAILPAGDYYVGDLCYTALGSDDIWTEVCNLSFSPAGKRGEVLTLKDGRKFVMLSTAYGDGSYPMVKMGYVPLVKGWLPVDSGTIGIIRWEDSEMSDDNDSGIKIKFDHASQVFDCATVEDDEDAEGFLIFGDYFVDTRAH